MAAYPAGVTIVTAMDAGGRPRGLTLSAFCSVSSQPPLVLTCLDRESKTLQAIKRSGGFTVNFLAAGRQDLATRCASKSDEKFDGVEWAPPSIPEAGPILYEDCTAYAVCRLQTSFEAGDHWILIGVVEDGDVRPDVPPLLYSRRTFGSWSDLD